MRAADHKVIEQPDVYERERFLQSLGDELVCLARLKHKTWVVMGQNDSGRVMAQGATHYLPRMHTGAIDCADEENFSGDDPVTRVERHHREELTLLRCQQRDQVLAHGLRCSQRSAGLTDEPKEKKPSIWKRELGGKKEPKGPKEPKAAKEKKPRTRLRDVKISLPKPQAKSHGGHPVKRLVGLKIGASQLAAARISNNGAAELVTGP